MAVKLKKVPEIEEGKCTGCFLIDRECVDVKMSPAFRCAAEKIILVRADEVKNMRVIFPDETDKLTREIVESWNEAKK